MKKYTIYEITNNINGKRYIGKHITEDENDNYMGSGIALSHAIKKYGKENFTKNILFSFDSEEEMNKKERELVNDEIVNNNSFYNIALGGSGGKIVLDPAHPLYEATIEKLKIAQRKRSAELSEIAKRQHADKKIGMYGKKQSEKQKAIVSQKLKGKKKNRLSVDRARKSLLEYTQRPEYVNPNKGNLWSIEQKVAMSEKIKSLPKYKCAACGKEMNKGNYIRYHENKCKTD